ncbi:alpha/beta hydrolase [Candidatus Thorarchaeota archaeon]|nr:MAG: alpha/beta hydrolase [Candidatus Thorarchaeota archaeon]
MKFMESEYVGYDGTRMFMATWLPDDEKVRALLIAIHGLGSHGSDLRNIGEYFAERGLGVFAPDMRGFGHYSGLKGHVMDFDEYIEDMHNIVMQVKDRYINKLTFLFGSSLGGQHVIRYVAKYPSETDGIMLSCPAVSETLDIGIGTRIGGQILSFLNLKRYFENEVDFEACCHDPEVIAEHENDPLRFDKVTPRFGIEGLKAAKEAFKLAPFIDRPALVQQAGDDKLVDPDKTREFFENLGSENKTWRFYEGLYHELHSEPQKDIVLGDMEKWLEERLPA